MYIYLSELSESTAALAPRARDTIIALIDAFDVLVSGSPLELVKRVCLCEFACVCVRVCVCVCVCGKRHTHTQIHTHTSFSHTLCCVRVHAGVYVCKRVHMRVHVFVRACVRACVRAFVRACVSGVGKRRQPVKYTY